MSLGGRSRWPCSLHYIELYNAGHGELEVWLPVFGLPNCLSVGTLQRLSTLLPSSATASQKLGVASLVAESHTKAVLAEPTSRQDKKKLTLTCPYAQLSVILSVAPIPESEIHNSLVRLRPKALSSLRDDRLAAKQELKACSNVLSHIGIGLEEVFPSCRCAPIDPDNEERRLHSVGDGLLAFVANKATGVARWDTVLEGPNSDTLRLILCPDQGGPLYAAYQFLAHNGANVGFIRDEL